MKEKIISFFSFLSYRKKLSFAFLSLLFIPMIMFSLLLIRQNIQDNENKLVEHYTSITKNDVENLTSIFNYCMKRFNTISQDSRLQVYINSSNNNLIKLIEINYYLNAFYSSLIFDEPGMRVNIYRSQTNFLPGSFIMNIGDIEPEVLIKCQDLNQNTVLLRTELNYIHLYTINRKISQSSFYIVEIVMPFNRIMNIFDYNQQSDIYLIDYWNESGEKVTLFENENGKKSNSYVFMYTIIQQGSIFAYQSKYQLMPDTQNYLPNSSKYGAIYFYVSNVSVYRSVPLICALLAGLYISVFMLVVIISRRLTNRLYVVIGQIQQQYEAGNELRTQLSGNKNDEFYIINTKLNEMFDTVQKYYKNIENINIEKKELETHLLQNMINPHFLYNTLDGIKWLSNDDRVSEIVDLLIEYYRASLNNGLLYLTVKDEFNMISKYIELQKFAYESDFQYIIEITDEVSCLYTIKFILQPFVENSILHGINKIGNNGFISAKAWRDVDNVIFEVTDNGCGITQEEFEKIYDASTGTYKTGYGISNVHKRIFNVFGQGYGVWIDSKEYSGTKVTIRIPALNHPLYSLTGN